ncbi:MAG TPA: hypothetical protein VKZ63_19295 [Kofleriaceae bacterium]|nr:hypothetical protein [Kofleriaceae bacterium]
MRDTALQLVHRARSARLAALLIGLFVALSGARVEAQRAARAKAKAKPAATSRTWTANGTRFRHETQRMHGKVVHWERGTTGKSGVTKLRGKTWGSSYKGHEWKSGDKTLRKVTVNGSDGTKRKVFSVTNGKGTKRTTITGLPGGQTRRITRWQVGNTNMTDMRDYGADGKLTKRQRFGHKAAAR